MQRSPAESSKVYSFCRYFVAFWMFVYGSAKIFRTQFVTLLHQLDTPFGDLSGFALVWGFFGYSDTYRLFIAAGEIGGAALLLHRRTTPLGALLLFGMLANIVLIDIVYAIGQALPIALVLFGMVGYILSVHWPALEGALFLPDNPSRPDEEPRSRTWTRYGARAAVFGAAVLLAYRAKLQATPRPTPLDGRWRVESIVAKGRPASATMLDSATMIYFEPEYSYRAVLRTPGGFRQARFDVDVPKRHLRIGEPYHNPERVLFDGGYQLSRTHLRLEDARSILLLTRGTASGHTVAEIAAPALWERLPTLKLPEWPPHSLTPPPRSRWEPRSGARPCPPASGFWVRRAPCCRIWT